MRSKATAMFLLSVFASIAIQGCSGGSDAKTGVKIQPGDYAHAPGGGSKPANPAAGAPAQGS